jgi:hypothetical protein
MFEDEASEHSEEEEDLDEDAELGYDDEERKRYEDMYKRKGMG